VVWVHPEVRDSEPPIYANVRITGLDCIDAEGRVAVPDGPGLGIVYDWDYIAAHATGSWSATV
jgi:L-alanine-DL-glutamate epimerase-like enolase superfamily enzyme